MKKDPEVKRCHFLLYSQAPSSAARFASAKPNAMTMASSPLGKRSMGMAIIGTTRKTIHTASPDRKAVFGRPPYSKALNITPAAKPPTMTTSPVV